MQPRFPTAWRLSVAGSGAECVHGGFDGRVEVRRIESIPPDSESDESILDRTFHLCECQPNSFAFEECIQIDEFVDCRCVESGDRFGGYNHPVDRIWRLGDDGANVFVEDLAVREKQWRVKPHQHQAGGDAMPIWMAFDVVESGGFARLDEFGSMWLPYLRDDRCEGQSDRNKDAL